MSSETYQILATVKSAEKSAIKEDTQRLLFMKAARTSKPTSEMSSTDTLSNIGPSLFITEKTTASPA